ncbi:MAG: hypothetical protein JWN54_748, partial [Mycobacterium sp.]|nr:hypothetical protein [Mycobacterium sp.]
LFNGLTLIAAVGFAGYTVRRKVNVRRKQEEAAHRESVATAEAPAGEPATRP